MCKCLQNHKKYKMVTVSRKYGLWPLIGIVMKWGSQWCDFCVFYSLLTACRQLKSANVCKITKNTKCSPLVESMGCDHSLELSRNEDRNDVTFICLTCSWQPVSSLNAQMSHKKYNMFTVSRKCVVTTHWNCHEMRIAMMWLLCV